MNNYDRDITKEEKKFEEELTNYTNSDLYLNLSLFRRGKRDAKERNY